MLVLATDGLATGVLVLAPGVLVLAVGVLVLATYCKEILVALVLVLAYCRTSTSTSYHELSLAPALLL